MSTQDDLSSQDSKQKVNFPTLGTLEGQYGLFQDNTNEQIPVVVSSSPRCFAAAASCVSYDGRDQIVKLIVRDPDETEWLVLHFKGSHKLVAILVVNGTLNSSMILSQKTA